MKSLVIIFKNLINICLLVGFIIKFAVYFTDIQFTFIQFPGYNTVAKEECRGSYYGEHVLFKVFTKVNVT
ncbi:hypothetical protein [Chryseobacterium wanjuense]|uniref:hypothetical protein n=1 Tax=Chryseobacterium wanjuense TaxID=356305 RepID=UPI0011146693|nr:hypothetical protein [Chryseobacterium wanjuense]